MLDLPVGCVSHVFVFVFFFLFDNLRFLPSRRVFLVVYWFDLLSGLWFLATPPPHTSNI